MADNVAITAGSGTTIAADDIGSGILAQRVKAVWGPDGTGNDIDVASGKPLPIQLRDAAGSTLSDATGIKISTTQLATLGQATAANSQSVVPASNPLSATANGLTSSRVNAAASTNATSLKATAGNLARVDLFNVAAYDVFFKLYNKASAPTVGTDVPVWTIPLKTGTGFSTTFPIGKSFATGIAYAITKLQADTDTTVVVALDVTGSIDWV